MVRFEQLRDVDGGGAGRPEADADFAGNKNKKDEFTKFLSGPLASGPKEFVNSSSVLELTYRV